MNPNLFFRVAAMLIWLGLPQVVKAQFDFATNNNALTITRYSGSGGAVIIPGATNGMPIVSIGASAFYNCYFVTSVTIPDSITSIGESAFLGSGLVSVMIPDSVTNIGTSAFWNCYDLISVTIPDSVTSIEASVFGATSLASVTIPNSVTSIGDQAFAYCYLTNITIGGSVTSIGKEAFYSCRGLTNVVIGNSVNKIADLAFSGCTRLIAITVDSASPAYSSADGVLFDKTLTTLIQCPVSRYGGYDVPDSVTTIGKGAFQFSDLTNVTIPNSVSSIGDRAFSGCTNLTGVYFRGNAPSLGGNYVFGDAFDLTIYYLPGTMGWGSVAGLPATAPWVLPTPVILDFSPGFGVGTNGFGFIISWATNIPVVVETSANLENPNWAPLVTNSLVGGARYFSDPQWTNHPNRFYRVRSP